MANIDDVIALIKASRTAEAKAGLMAHVALGRRSECSRAPVKFDGAPKARCRVRPVEEASMSDAQARHLTCV